MNRAEIICAKFKTTDSHPRSKGIRELCYWLGIVRGKKVHDNTVARWCRDRNAAGYGGQIPLKAIPEVIAAGRLAGVELKKNDFI